MRKATIGIVAIAALTGLPAFAADMPVKAPPPPPVVTPSWTGFYIGASAGYGWNQGGNIDLASIGTGNLVITTPAANAIPAGFDAQPKGFIGGGDIGYNYQWRQWVLGIEADLSGASIKGTAAQTGTATVVSLITFPVNGSAIGEQKLDLFGTVRGRMGVVAADRLLIYATGGLAYGHVESNTSTGDVPTQATILPAQGSTSGMLAGWTVGGGFEWALAPHWSFKTEYLYYDLGSRTYALSPNVVTSCCTVTEGTVNSTVSATFRGSIARVGINYKL
jgi:outer membrane immunogenic protein